MKVLSFHRSDLVWDLEEEEEDRMSELYLGYKRRATEFSPPSLVSLEPTFTAEQRSVAFEDVPGVVNKVREIGGEPHHTIEYFPKGLFAYEEEERGSAPTVVAVGSPGTHFITYEAWVPVWEKQNRVRTGR